MRVKARKPPTTQSIARQVSRLMADLSVVYGDRHRVQKTNERGTISVKWRSGRAVQEDALRGEGECDE